MKKEINYEKGVYFFAFIGIIALAGISIYSWGHKNFSFFDESAVSFLAFTILIVTTLMQNQDLKIQRKNLELQRAELKATNEELKGSKLAQEKQYIEMEESNRVTKDTVKQTQFFELLRIKEQILNENFNGKDPFYYKNNFNINFIKKLSMYVSREDEKLIQEIVKYNSLIETTSIHYPESINIKSVNHFKEILILIHKYANDENYTKLNKRRLINLDNKFREIFEQSYKEYKNSVTFQEMRLEQLHQIITNLIQDEYVPGRRELLGTIINNQHKIRKDLIRKATGGSYRREPLTLKDIYNRMILNEEKILYACIEELNYEKFLLIVKEYNDYLS